MATPIPYAIINGARASFPSIIYKIDGQEFTGFKSITLTRKRDQAMVYGANPDPIGKTRGKNSYEHTAEVYVAEWKTFMLDHFGAGYGDRYFSNEVTITESGFDTQTHLVEGCTISSSELAFSEGNDALTTKVDFNPVKILFNGIDDNATPLQGAPAQA